MSAKINLTRTKAVIALYRVTIEPTLDRMLEIARTDNEVTIAEEARVAAVAMVAAAYIHDTRDRNSLSALYALRVEDVEDFVRNLEAGGHA